MPTENPSSGAEGHPDVSPEELREREFRQEVESLLSSLRQWIFEFEVSIDRSDNDSSISLSVMPLAFFGSRKRGDFYDPMFGN